MNIYPTTRQLTKVFTILLEHKDGLNIKSICSKTFIGRCFVEKSLKFFIMIGKVKKIRTGKINLYKWVL